MSARTIALLVALAGPAYAQETATAETDVSPPRFTLALSGAFGLGSLSYQSTGRLEEFAEQGRLEADYDTPGGSGFEAGLVFRFNRRLGVGASFGLQGRKGSAAYRADLPHPLYVDRDRHVESSTNGLPFDEQVVHLDLVVHGRTGRLDLSAFAGPSWFKVKSSLVAAPVLYSHVYPYDTASVRDVSRVTDEASAVGFNVGAGADFHLGPHVALGTQLRFGRAKVELQRPNEEAVRVDAGGLRAAAGIRFLF